MECHRCSHPVPLASGERVEFRQACGACDADLHVCLNCRHHDPGTYNECSEPKAERVFDRERANRCDEFEPRSASVDGSETLTSAKREWDTLFKK